MRKIRAKPIILKILRLMRDGRYIREFSEVDSGNKSLLSCPFHSSGMENRPSCVLNFSPHSRTVDDVIYRYPAGNMYCFAGCPTKSIIHAYAHVVYNDDDVATVVQVCRDLAEQIHEDFEDLLTLTGLGNEEVEFEEEENAEPMVLPTGFVPCDYFPPRQPFEAAGIPNYALNRGISADVLKLFGVFEDTEQKKIVFPYRDEDGTVKLYATRRTDKKAFDYPPKAPRVIYGAFELMKMLTSPDCKLPRTVFIVESVFNALMCWTYGFPAIAMFGTSCDYVELKTLLKRCEVSTIAIATDNDANDPKNPGLKGRNKLNKYLKEFSRHAFLIPEDWTNPNGSIKDINDLTFNEFQTLCDRARIRRI